MTAPENEREMGRSVGGSACGNPRVARLLQNRRTGRSIRERHPRGHNADPRSLDGLFRSGCLIPAHWTEYGFILVSANDAGSE